MRQIISVEYSQIISDISNIHLSLSEYASIEKKNLTIATHTKAGRLSAYEHVQKLGKENIIKNPESPLLVISVRNVMANLRCIGYQDGENEFASVNDEVFASRPYHILGKRKDNGKMVINEFVANSDDKSQFRWFLSGIPVLWDNMDEDEIFKRIVTEEYDHSHVWQIYRGAHPLATEESIYTWEGLQEIFVRTLDQTREIAFNEMLKYASDKNLEREDNYLHNIIGVDESGEKIYQLIGTGRLEELGIKIGKMGAKRAICVDNSGSIVVQSYPKGANHDFIQEFAAPNHRSPGTAYLILELVNKTFSLK
jgi:hypothetical protein